MNSANSIQKVQFSPLFVARFSTLFEHNLVDPMDGKTTSKSMMIDPSWVSTSPEMAKLVRERTDGRRPS